MVRESPSSLSILASWAGSEPEFEGLGAPTVSLGVKHAPSEMAARQSRLPQEPTLPSLQEPDLVTLSETARSGRVTTPLEDLRLRMEAAAAALDFEEARRLRDQLSLLRGQVDASPLEEIDTSRLQRQQPGAMGLGTSDQKMTPPAGWKPPPRPDPMTSGHKTPRRRR